MPESSGEKALSMFRVVYWNYYHIPSQRNVIIYQESLWRRAYILEEYCYRKSIRWWFADDVMVQISEQDIMFVASLYIEDFVTFLGGEFNLPIDV